MPALISAQLTCVSGSDLVTSTHLLTIPSFAACYLQGCLAQISRTSRSYSLSLSSLVLHLSFFFFNDSATTEIYPLSLHDALLFFLKEHAPHLHSHFSLACRLPL